MEHFYKTVRTFIRWGFGSLSTYFVAKYSYLTLTDIKGTVTIVDIAAEVWRADKWFKILVLICVILFMAVILSVLLAWNERKERRKAIGRCSRTDKERELDENRSSSNLTPEGKTNPEDL